MLPQDFVPLSFADLPTSFLNGNQLCIMFLSIFFRCCGKHFPFPTERTRKFYIYLHLAVLIVACFHKPRAFKKTRSPFVPRSPCGPRGHTPCLLHHILIRLEHRSTLRHEPLLRLRSG